MHPHQCFSFAIIWKGVTELQIKINGIQYIYHSRFQLCGTGTSTQDSLIVHRGQDGADQLVMELMACKTPYYRLNIKNNKHGFDQRSTNPLRCIYLIYLWMFIVLLPMNIYIVIFALREQLQAQISVQIVMLIVKVVFYYKCILFKEIAMFANLVILKNDSGLFIQDILQLILQTIAKDLINHLSKWRL